MTPLASVKQLQANLKRVGLYPGAVDGLPGGLTCDGLVRLLVGPGFMPPAGLPLAKAIPPSWWASANTVNMLLANVYAECGFRPLQENLNYSAERLATVWPTHFPNPDGALPYAHHPEALANLVYGGRMGNDAPGDGWKYRGRGWPELTGKGNYCMFSNASAGYDLINDPDRLLDLDVSAMVTVSFCAKLVGVQAMASGDVVLCRKRWNGGTNGLTATLDAFAKLTTMWGPQ